MRLYAATGNAGKLAEFAACGGAAGVEVLALPGLERMPEPVEDADTFMGNAELKAVGYSRQAPGMMVFADDSGIEVEALGGAPGVRSARFAEDAGFLAGSGAGRGVGVDERNNALLLQRLTDVGGARGARFRCALALARDGVVVLRAEGSVEGEVLREARGVSGFGYDPLFWIPGGVAGVGVTFAEMSREQKWEVGHRGRAFRALLKQMAEAGLK